MNSNISGNGKVDQPGCAGGDAEAADISSG